MKRRRALYDAERYFDSKYNVIFEEEFSDRVTISPDYDLLAARHHYNSVENGIIEHLAAHRPRTHPAILDVGSGAGHWIDFFRELFDPSLVVGIELSERCADELRRKYADEPAVAVVEDDVSRAGLRLDRRFDVIVAIGVMFHIVDDDAWQRAVSNLAGHLSDEGTIVVGGQFGLATRDIGFAPCTEFSTWTELQEAEGAATLVKMRIRSLRHWRRCARRNGLQVSGIKRTPKRRMIAAPENNLLFLTARR
jgi:SAM-dependent methyltransferase